MKFKQTTRVFTLAVPAGTRPQQIRHFVTAADGTQYPVDREVEVPTYAEKVVEYVCGPGGPRPDEVTERWALAQEPPGTLAVAAEDRVEYVEVPDADADVHGP
jgi:hypothetical protein